MSKKEAETKHERFRRVASHRTNEILDRIRRLENCSNKQIYEYEEEEVQKIFRTLESRLKEAKSQFQTRDNSAPFKL